MGFGPKQVFTATIASGTSTSAALDLGTKSFRNMAVYVVTTTTNAAMTVYGGSDSAALSPVLERVNTAPVQHQQLTIATATSGSWTMLDAVPLRYLQFVGTATFANGVTVYVAAQD